MEIMKLLCVHTDGNWKHEMYGNNRGITYCDGNSFKALLCPSE